jgi:light-regulated signal transduction histidine kinase (bacteriophytochrome)
MIGANETQPGATDPKLNRIRELTIANEELQRRNDELERRVGEVTADLDTARKELEDYTYSVSHDLRAPLRAIEGFSRILVNDHAAELSEPARRHVEVVRGAAQRLGTLIDGILALSRVIRQSVKVRVVDVNGLVRECLAAFHLEIESRAVQVRVSALPSVRGDARLLGQMFEQLVGNALKYSRGSRTAVIEIGHEVTSGGPAFFVRDNGVGFDMRYAGKLFGLFQRMHRMEDYEGNGVGLAMVHRIVVRHGGRVWAEAEVDKGATFYFSLPGVPGPL